MSTEIQANLQELVDHAIKANEFAIHGVKIIEFKQVLSSGRTTLECICKGIFLDKGQPYSGNLNSQINRLCQSNFISEDKKEQFHRLRQLGNNGSHSNNSAHQVTRDDAKEARQLLNEILNFFYAEISGHAIPEKLRAIMQAAPIKDLQAGYKKLYTEGTLDAVPLSDIYVLPRATFSKYSVKTSNLSEKFEAIPSCSDLHQFVKHFMDNELESHYEEIKHPTSQALILLGAPGQGKTSFCKRVLYDFINETKVSKANIYYVKLRDLSEPTFMETPFSYLIEHKFLPQTIAKDLEKAVLILDGLDEFYLHNGGHLSQVDAFIQTLLQQLKNPRYQETKIILTSRFGYLSLDKLNQEKNLTIASIDTFNENQQIEWIEKYQKAVPDKEIKLNATKIREIHTKKEFYQKQPLDHFKELFEQPVLLHLFVLSGLEVNTETQRTQIYSQLFDKLSSQSWEEEPSQALKKINSVQLKNISKVIAFEMYKNNKTFLDKTALDDLPEVQTFYDQIEVTGSEQKKELYRYLFIAFYWQEKNKEESEVLEFLHKSLQEYLVAEKIWDEFQKIATASCTSSKDALAIIWPFASPQILSKEIRENLVEIINNDTENHSALVEKMKAYFPDLLEKQFMQECLPIEPMKGGVHTFYLYFLVLNTVHFKVHSKTESKEPSYLDLETSDWSFDNLFNISQLYYRGKSWNLSCCSINDYLKFAYYLNFSKIEASKVNNISFNDIKLYETSFNQSTLERVSMNKVELNYCTFKQSQLNSFKATEVRFNRNDCTGITIKHSNFQTASTINYSLFIAAKIIASNFNTIKFCQTSFEGAVFHEERDFKLSYLRKENTGFIESTFNGCSFKKADLTCVSFKAAKINGSSFEEANLTKTTFSETILEHGYFPKDFSTITKKEVYVTDYSVDNVLQMLSFNNAFGKSVSFQKAVLKGVSFKNAKLSAVDFSDATIESLYHYNKFHPNSNINASANFEQAELIQAKFKNAKLKGVNFNQAVLKNANFSNASIQNHIHEDFNSPIGEEEDKTIYSSFKGADLEHSNFQNAILFDINFQEANLTNATFQDANLSDCNFFKANLDGVDLASSVLNNANFSKAKLSGVNLTSSALENVNFEEADFTGTKWNYYNFMKFDKNYDKVDQGQYLQLSPKTLVYYLSKQILTQLTTVKSLYKTKGIHAEWKEWLIEKGYKHLFEAPKTLKPPSPKPPNTPD